MWSSIYFAFLRWFIHKTYNKTISEHMFFITFIIEIIIIYCNNFEFLVLYSLLLPICISDIINNDVHTQFCVLIAIFGFIINKTITPTSFFVPMLLALINKFLKGMGQGDIYLLFSLAFLFDLYDLSRILFLSSTLNIAYSIFVKKKSYAFVPFISIATMIIYLC